MAKSTTLQIMLTSIREAKRVYSKVNRRMPVKCSIAFILAWKFRILCSNSLKSATFNRTHKPMRKILLMD